MEDKVMRNTDTEGTDGATIPQQPTVELLDSLGSETNLAQARGPKDRPHGSIRGVLIGMRIHEIRPDDGTCRLRRPNDRTKERNVVPLV